MAISRFATISLQASLLLDTFAVAQAADVASTQWGLMLPRLYEANPMIAWCMQELGALWWLPKFALVVFAFWLAPRLTRIWPIAAVTGLTLLAVLNNLAWML